MMMMMDWTLIYCLISGWSTGWSLNGSQSIDDSHLMSCQPGKSRARSNAKINCRFSHFFQIARYILGNYSWTTPMSPQNTATKLKMYFAEEKLCYNYQSFYEKYHGTGLWSVFTLSLLYLFCLVSKSGIPPLCKQSMICVEFGTFSQLSPLNLVWYMLIMYNFML